MSSNRKMLSESALARLKFLRQYFGSCSVLGEEQGLLTSALSARNIDEAVSWHPASDCELVLIYCSSNKEQLLIHIKSMGERALRGTRFAIICHNEFRDEKALLSATGLAIASSWRASKGARVYLLRLATPPRSSPSLSIIVPAKNERGNIKAVLESIPQELSKLAEVVFVEGGSVDGTWAEIQLQLAKRPELKVRAIQQVGRGKSNAVDHGVQHATGELVVILDADLTVPPEKLTCFYDAYCRGDGDIINGDRMTRPMERKAMRHLNYIGNVVFANLLSKLVGARLPDVLCGTKLLSRADYLRIKRWAADVNCGDPFGDFELILGAHELGLGFSNVAVDYRARRYGSTQIHRFRDGLCIAKTEAVTQNMC